jgi:hypothetical protein
MVMPNFLVVGAAKSATTAMNNYLSQHPEIFMSPVKEPRFFSYAGLELDMNHPVLKNGTITSLEQYEKLFDGVKGEKAIGEASPSYLHNERAPKNIKKYVPEIKMIAILRNPAERAFSHFLHFIKCGFEHELNFEQALTNLELSKNGWRYRKDYMTFGFYGEQLSRYYDLFSREQIKVLIYDDFKDSPMDIIREVFQFLEVDSGFKPDMAIKHNKSGIPKHAFLHKLLSNRQLVNTLGAPLKLMLPKHFRRQALERVKNRNLVKPELEQKIRNKLIEIYRQDIEILEGIIGRDLSSWYAKT